MSELKPEAQKLLDYLHVQFPATVGHMPLRTMLAELTATPALDLAPFIGPFIATTDMIWDDRGEFFATIHGNTCEERARLATQLAALMNGSCSIILNNSNVECSKCGELRRTLVLVRASVWADRHDEDVSLGANHEAATKFADNDLIVRTIDEALKQANIPAQ